MYQYVHMKHYRIYIIILLDKTFNFLKNFYSFSLKSNKCSDLGLHGRKPIDIIRLNDFIAMISFMLKLFAKIELLRRFLDVCIGCAT